MHTGTSGRLQVPNARLLAQQATLWRPTREQTESFPSLAINLVQPLKLTTYQTTILLAQRLLYSPT